MRIFLLWSFALAAAACTKTNPNACCTSEADCGAIGLPVGTDCAGGLVCRGNQCIAESCASAADCDAAAPYCNGQTCTESCTTDDECPGFGGNASDKFCIAGGCVACRIDQNDCPSSAPVCEASACRACKLDNECPSQVCDSDAGTCADASSIFYVTNGGSETSTCTQSSPCSVARAFALVSANPVTMRFLDGTYPVGLAFASGTKVTVIGPGATIAGAVDASSQVTVPLNSTVTLRGLTLSDGAKRPFTCVGTGGTTTLNLRDVSMPAGGPLSDNCTLNIVHSSIASLLEMDDAGSVTISQSLVGSLELQFANNLVIDVENTSMRGLTSPPPSHQVTGRIAFSTIEVSNYINCYGHLTYENDIIMQDGSQGTTFPYTVFHNNGVCTSQFDHNLVWPQDVAIGSNMLIMDPKVIDAASYNVHLTAGSPAIDAANPTATLSVDLEGTGRPQGSGRDLGAYELH